MANKEQKITSLIKEATKEQKDGEWDIERKAENIFMKESKLQELLGKLKSEKEAKNLESRSITKETRKAQTQVEEDSHNLRGFMRQTNMIGDEMKDISLHRASMNAKLKKLAQDLEGKEKIMEVLEDKNRLLRRKVKQSETEETDLQELIDSNEASRQDILVYKNLLGIKY